MGGRYVDICGVGRLLWQYDSAGSVRIAREEKSMATATKPINIGTLITRSAKMKSGRPVIAGTSVMVMRVAGWYKQGMDAEEIAREMELTLAQVYAALAYYHANKAEIEAQIAEERVLYEKYSTEERQQGRVERQA
jgi:uncharacterized protein (DUF433 family)